MQRVLTLEYLGGLVLALYLFSRLHFAWWLYPALLLAPDVSMLGYIAGPRTGAALYNFFHHLGVAALVFVLGGLAHLPIVQLAGTILLGHLYLDRLLGYGLKYADGFQHTHLTRLT